MAARLAVRGKEQRRVGVLLFPEHVHDFCWQRDDPVFVILRAEVVVLFFLHRVRGVIKADVTPLAYSAFCSRHPVASMKSINARSSSSAVALSLRKCSAGYASTFFLPAFGKFCPQF
jgi:hypothetical protein